MSKWKETTLKDYIEVVNGYAFKSKDFISEKEEDCLPVLKIKNVASGEVVLKDSQYHKYDEKYSKFLVEKNDILLALTGNHPQAITQVVGEASISKLDESALLNQRVAKIKPQKGMDNYFLYYFLKDDATHDYIANQSSGSANQANISKGNIEDIPITLPPLPEQKAIASVLSSLDDKIDLLHRQNKTLEAMAETLFRQWFVEEADESWEEGIFGNFVDNIKNSLKSNINLSDRRYVPIDEIPMKQFGLSSYRPIEEAKTSLIGFEKNDILFGAMRAYFHRVNYSHFSGVTRTTTMVLRPKKNYYFSFSLCLLNLESSVAYANLHSKGSTMPYATWDNSLEIMPCPSPPEKTLKEFHNFILPMINKISNNIESIFQITSLRNSLLPKLISGEVKVGL